MQAWSGGTQQAWHTPSNSCSVQNAINVHLVPHRFPVCPRCKELAGMLWDSD